MVSFTAKPSRRNSGFHASIAPEPESVIFCASLAALPTGTVDFPTTRSPEDRCGISASIAASTKVMSAELEPRDCGVPTATKCTRAPLASLIVVVYDSRPVSPAERRISGRPGS